MIYYIKLNTSFLSRSEKENSLRPEINNENVGRQKK